MVEIANFKKQEYGAVVATIVETNDTIVEVVACNDGEYNLIVHNRQGETDRWDDLSARLTEKQFALLGTVAQHMRDNACRPQAITTKFDEVRCLKDTCEWPECECPRKDYPTGTFTCPICQKDTPHNHSDGRCTSPENGRGSQSGARSASVNDAPAVR